MSTTPSHVRQRRGTILVVEHDERCREMMTERLERSGYGVAAVLDPMSGFDALVSHSIPTPTLIVLDGSPPNAASEEFLRVLRSYLRFAQVPVLFCTDDEELEARLSSEPLVGWLRKPFGAEAFLDAVHQMFLTDSERAARE